MVDHCNLEEMRPAWGGMYPYCVLCSRWSSDEHLLGSRHRRRCQSPQAPSESAEELNLRYLGAADRIAVILSDHGEAGFGGPGCPEMQALQVHLAAVRRMVIIASLPPRLRKDASHCGGVRPGAGLRPFADTPLVADPTNRVYAAAARSLLDRGLHGRILAETGVRADGLALLCRLNEEHLADVVEAALAAANAAADHEQGMPRTWAGLRGGVWGRGDVVSDYLHARVIAAASPTPPPPPPPFVFVSPLTVGRFYQAVCGWTAQEEGHLSFTAGQNVRALPPPEEGFGWAYASELKNGTKGWVPPEFFDPIIILEF